MSQEHTLKRKQNIVKSKDDDTNVPVDDTDQNMAPKKQNNGEEEDEEQLSEVYMTLFLEKTRLGVAVYDVLSTKLKTAQIPITYQELPLVRLELLF